MSHLKKLSHLFNEKYSSLVILLKEFDVPLSARRANQILLEEGIIIELNRSMPGRPKEVKRFKILSGKGLKYGRNIPSDTHPVQARIQFYREGFQSLIDNVFKKYITCEVK